MRRSVRITDVCFCKGVSIIMFLHTDCITSNVVFGSLELSVARVDQIRLQAMVDTFHDSGSTMFITGLLKLPT